MANYARTTIATLRTLLKERIGGEGIFWTDSEVNYALNEALAVWQVLTGDWVSTYEQRVPAGTAVLSLDSTVKNLGITRVRRAVATTSGFATSGTGTALYPVSIQEMDQGYYGRQGAASGTPDYWAPFGIDKIVLYPKAASTQTIGLQYYDADPRMSLTGTDYFNMGDEEILRILDYAQWVLAFKEGLSEAFENVDPFKQMFLTAAKLRNAKLRATAQYKDYMGTDRDEEKSTKTATPQEGLRGSK